MRIWGLFKFLTLAFMLAGYGLLALLVFARALSALVSRRRAAGSECQKDGAREPTRPGDECGFRKSATKFRQRTALIGSRLHVIVGFVVINQGNQGNQAITFIKRIMTSITMLVTLMSTGAMEQSHEASARAQSPGSQSKLRSDVTAAKTELIKAAAEYKSSLAKVVSMYEAELKNAQQQFEASKQLFVQGAIPKKELDDSEKQIAETQAKIDEARKQTAEADDLIAESSVVEDDEPARAAGRTPSLAGCYTATPALIRYTGTAHWTLAYEAKVGSFFLSRFGHQMPISAYGQTATHDRLGFDHRNAVDVAVHPDSAEGQALTAYLRSQGIPFIAFRHAVSGSATGAHIHIGYPSRRVCGSSSARVTARLL